MREAPYIAICLALVFPVMSLAATPSDSEAEDKAETSSESSNPSTNPEGLSPEDYQLIVDALGAEAGSSPEALQLTAPASVPEQSPTVQGQSFMNPAIALIADIALAYFSSDEPLQLGAHDPTRTGFTLQQLELHAESKVDQYFDLQANLVFSEYGVEIEELYAQTLSLPWSLQVRVGQFLIPFGRINPTHPHTWSFVDQALMVGTYFGGEGGRGMGVETSWLLPIPWYAKAVISVNQNAGQCCASSYFAGSLPTINGPEDFLYTGRIEQFFELSDDWSILFGASYMLGENQSGRGNQSHLRATDLHIKYKPVDSSERFYTSLQIEWVQRDRQVPGQTFQTHAGYAELKSGLNPNWEVATRAEWVAGLGSGPLDDSLEGSRNRYAAQVTWHPTHFSRLRFQVSYDMPNWREEGIWASMLALEVLAGAHGSHTY
jgi:hypothetical protein